ncbi:hypothetical protein SAMN02799630_00734 [Paenibacillus sp. UNCCL117]|uniref:hypothetical protein n=1 Tax=unclassified Paenibacillus TaxID=185978 RepID=UPI00088D03A1|nr:MULTISPECIES: hypothetical protein [unclassified Paenibacillus]SDC18082.1 hypothetical protein SAMN04488602_101533 [Paenibacillus sp. cl123]SFW18135.1 hypothetical protein SAMN02799630_00734 [Paenibacillus sp. UNCCL117]
MNAEWIELFMWLFLFASITLAFMILLLDFVSADTVQYDMEHLWNHSYTLQELHLDLGRD